MLKLKNVTKIYNMGEYQVNALRGVTLAFRESEFVSIIGASGCGKSTMLNIIGGLDRYTTGDLTIGSTSTKDFRAEQWDAYRNATIGFVFQNYNLIPHLTVLENVALALSLSGVNKTERNQKAIKALERVGMGAELRKKPSQLSGGQMQRVAIARALVNDPKIVLADEPTGALDSELSVQVMDVLKEVAEDRLVIMVTHNNELADTYSTRIIKLNDGLVESDTNPYDWDPEEDCELQYVYSQKQIDSGVAVANNEIIVEDNKEKAQGNKVVSLLNKLGIGDRKKGGNSPFKATSMKAKTAFQLSLNNLVTKKRRTFLTSFAGSIGIISLALVLSISNGFNIFLDNMQTSILASVPVGIYEYSMDYSVLMNLAGTMMETDGVTSTYPNVNEIYPISGATASSDFSINDMITEVSRSVGRNDISEEFVEYLNDMDPSWTKSINSYYGVKMNILSQSKDADGNTKYLDVSPDPKVTKALSIAMQVLGDNGQEPNNWYQLAGSKEFVGEYYDVISGRYPSAYNEIVLVVDGDNKISVESLAQFGLDVYERDSDGKVLKDEKDNPQYRESISFDEILDVEFKLVHNNTFYNKVADNEFVANDPTVELYNNSDNITLKVVGILRNKPGAMAALVGTAFCYTNELGEYVVNNAKNSDVAKAQQAILDANPKSHTLVVRNFTLDGSKYNTLMDDTKLDNPNAMLNMMNFMTSGLYRTGILKALGVDVTPVYITVYPTDFNSKVEITEYLDTWNAQFEDDPEKQGVIYFDISEMFIQNLRIAIDLMTYVLVAVASISLIVSCVMISIITSNSVVERTREIGILRSLGARKRDISRVFDAETAIIGLFSGVLGIGIAYALVPLINLLLANATGFPSLLNLSPIHAAVLVVLSLTLTILSGLIPSQSAANKNVVDALRIE